ncbi:unnamed protein product [Adineta ricciae]|uniref:Acetyl-coenzyme A transporter 1 n=1 Tax=Adineta ricciae TaxID=249248 RepID=A0A815DC80_ADIRI|nr:unnamed protein product [Adineta ricciae]CAF1420743.1 unnamed protein product [Adineta ricciae]
MVNKSGTSLSSICLITILYTLEGLNIGLMLSIPLFLIYYGATWKDRGTFNFTSYPFSMKLLWAPLVDVFYIKRFGRRKSWIVPTQLLTAVVLLIASFFIESLVVQNHVVILTIIFFIVVFLTATDDVCIDGFAITLFATTNPQWASTSQGIGQTFGRFLGSSFLLTLESANFTNKFIRAPLALPSQTSGLFSLAQFIRVVAVIFVLVTICVIFVREKQETVHADDHKASDLSLMKVYHSILKLLKKKCIQQLAIIMLLLPIPFVPFQAMSNLALISHGVPRDSLALVNIPVTLITVFAPLIIRRTKRPLLWLIKMYILNLLIAIPVAVYIHFTGKMLASGYYYPILILLMSISDFIKTLISAACVGFFASICEPRIGGTYMTFLVTISNLGGAINSSIVLYVSNWLPKKYDYLLATCACEVLGILLLVFAYRVLIRLQDLPTHKWYTTEQVNAVESKLEDLGQSDPKQSFISEKEIQSMS